MRDEFLKWCVMTAAFGFGLGLVLLVALSSPFAAETEDPYSLARYVLLRLTAIAIAGPALTGLMLFVDFITPGDWMKAIGDDPKAASYVMSAVVVAIGAILCWT